MYLSLSTSLSLFVSLPQQRLLGGLWGLDGGLLHKALRDPSGAARDRQALVRLLSRTLGLVGGEGQRYAPLELQQVEVGARLRPDRVRLRAV